MPILNFNLQHVATQITQVVTLYDPSPAFQFSKDVNGNYIVLNGDSVTRSDGRAQPAVASSGFLASFNQLGPIAGVYPLPPNSFAVNLPSLVYGNSVSTNDDGTYSVIQINSNVANVEPGFSRIRIDYTDNINANHTEYFDCPFYEFWDITGRELNQIISYAQGGINLLQREIDDIRLEVQYAMSRAFWRGTSVSGQVQWQPATQGLLTGALNSGELQHDIPSEMLGKSCSIVADGVCPENFLNYNIPGLVNNGNFVTGGYDSDGVGGFKGSYCLGENTDGTLTFWMYDTNWNDTNVFGEAWSFVFSDGRIDQSTASSSTGAAIAFTGYSFGSGNLEQAVYSTPGNANTVTPNGGNQYFFADTTVHDSTGPQGSSNLMGAAQIFFTYGQGNMVDNVFIGNFPCYRMRLRPVAPAGTVINLLNINHFTQSGIGSLKGYYDAHAGGTLQLTLRGSTPQNPTIGTVSPSNLCAGNSVTLTGTNFSSNFGIYINNLGTPVNNVAYQSSTQCSFVVPSGVPAGAGTLIMSNGSYQTSAAVTISPSPQISTVYDTSSSQYDQGVPTEHITISGTNFGATQGTGTLAIGPTIITPISWSDNQITAIIPAITVGTYQLQIHQGCAIASRQFVIPNRPAVSGPPQLFINPGSLTLHNSQVQQFFAYVLMAGNQPLDVTNSSIWKVNGVQGGDVTDGTITAQGYYQAPTTIIGTPTSTITATVTFEDSGNPLDPYNGTVITGTSVVALQSAQSRLSPYATVSVTSQVNIFLGDGRAGYIPVGQSVNAYPGQYVYAQFNESIDPQTQTPIASNTDIQQLNFQTISALDPNVANVIYNLSGMTVDPSSHTIKTKRTIVLGIIDPSDGNWHSLWDIGIPPIQPADNDMLVSPMKSLSYYAETLPAFTAGHEFSGSVVDYIDDLAGAHQKQLTSLRKRSNTLVVGNCFFNEKLSEFEILDNLTIFMPDEQNRYKAKIVFSPQKLNISQGQFMLVDSENLLRVSKIGEKLDANSIVIGVVLDRFYTQWPILPQYLVSM
jgi:hypothetical protein